jgi:hypothetical protein
MAREVGVPDSCRPVLEKWPRRVIPLPKEISVEGQRRLCPGQIGLTHRLGDVPALRTALRHLRTIAQADGPAAEFVLRLSLADDPDVPSEIAGRLRSLPNSDQAYAITPIRDARTEGLLLVGTTPTGLLYASLTLSQIASPAGPDVEIPIVHVVDWPDLAERGQWGGNAENDLAWTSRWKLNVLEANAQVRVGKDGRTEVGISRDVFRQGAELGVKIVPFVLHLEQIAAYAGLRNRKDVTSTPDPSKPLPSDYVPGLCMLSPATQGLVGEWLAEIARIDGVTDIMVWLSEDAAPCFCEKCLGKEPYELEVRCLLSAFERAKAVNPAVRLRLLTTQGSYRVNDRILALAPLQVGISYYDGGRTYDSSRSPMIYGLLEDFARSGRWLGVYPQITHAWRTVLPWTAPQFVRFRAEEFVQKGLHCMIGYAVPSNRYHEFNVMAMAEWTWNARGRAPEEFARAYATVAGIGDPDLFARWAILAGDAGWDLAESRLFLRLIYDPALGLAGDVPFDHRFQQSALTYSDRLKGALTSAREALGLARQATVPDMIDQSECLLASLHALASLRTVSNILRQKAENDGDKECLREALDRLDRCAAVVQTRLMSWGYRVSVRDGTKVPARLRDTANVLCRTCDAARAAAARFAIPDPHPEHRLRELGAWSAKDFVKSPRATLRFDHAGIVPDAGGTYDVGFSFSGGAYGAVVERLAVTTAGDDGKTVAEAEDMMQEVGRWEKWHELRIQIPGTGAGTRLALEVQLSGIPENAPEGRRTCSGTVSIRKAWSPDIQADFPDHGE